jgi:hypothetical protein
MCVIATVTGALARSLYAATARSRIGGAAYRIRKLLAVTLEFTLVAGLDPTPDYVGPTGPSSGANNFRGLRASGGLVRHSFR